MSKMKTNHISKSDFLKLNEDDVMFITNPGRMGDEDGSTFIIKKDNDFIIYRVAGWMYGSSKDNISLEDTKKQFPKWHKTWKNKKSDKYEYLYMGFGNGLSIDKSIYNDYEPYLYKEIELYLDKNNENDKEDLQYAAIFNTWDIAFEKMIKDKKYYIK